MIRVICNEERNPFLPDEAMICLRVQCLAMAEPPWFHYGKLLKALLLGSCPTRGDSAGTGLKQNRGAPGTKILDAQWPNSIVRSNSEGQAEEVGCVQHEVLQGLPTPYSSLQPWGCSTFNEKREKWTVRFNLAESKDMTTS